MKLGGFNTGARAFSGGMDNKAIEESTKDEIAQLTATSSLDDDKFDWGPKRKWDIKFEDVAKVFLSRVLVQQLVPESPETTRACNQYSAELLQLHIASRCLS